MQRSGRLLTFSVVALFLAYNANKGLPFVPTTDIRLETRSAQRLVVGNEVREGGFRIGQVTKMENVRLSDGSIGATLYLKLDKAAGDIPKDSSWVIRPKSTLGSKYVDLIRGKSRETLPQGATLTAAQGRTSPPELDDLFETFTAETREDIRANLATFGAGLAGRGADLNRTLEALPPLLRDVQPVMRTLADPDTQLGRFVEELQDTATITAPASRELSRLFTRGADVFEALSREPAALDQAIARTPALLREGTPALRAQRPFLRRLAGLSDEITGTAEQLRTSAPAINRAVRAGTRTLPGTTRLSANLETAFDALRDLSRSPTTNLVLDGLATTATTLGHTLRWLGPHITVCNYWNYFWTYIADHFAQEIDTGTVQRILIKSSPPMQPNAIASFGASRPANGGTVGNALVPGDPVFLHGQPYGRAVDEQGRADCESGQRGYPRRLATGIDPDLQIAVDPRTPGNQGPTYTGKPRVPEGQTFSAEPTGLAPQVVQP